LSAAPSGLETRGRTTGPTIPDMDAAFLARHFESALPYDRYAATGTPEQQRRWQQFHATVKVTEDQRTLLGSFTRRMNVLVVSGIWCGDCVQQVPMLDHIAAANRGAIDVRYVDRDERKDLSPQLRINGGDRVPVAVFMAEDFEPCAVFGDRTLSRYRALAQKQLGAACSTGLFGPAADEVADTLRDWVDEFERVQLMLRLSGRLRQKHGD
jgi:thiol-disulfide isomerase/thioredoxin